MWRIVGRVGCGVALLCLGGCWWPVPGGGPGRQANNAAEDQITAASVAGIEELWSAPTDDGAVGDPVTSLRGVHVGDATSVYAFADHDGSRLWSYAPDGAGSTPQPFVTGEEVWAGGAGGPTVALDASTGAVVRTIVGDQTLLGLGESYAVFGYRIVPGAAMVDGLTAPPRPGCAAAACSSALMKILPGRCRWETTPSSMLASVWCN